ncbi:MAG: hypothetical protein IJD04_00285, partial [Desulfovibrionaceae bacterium]|nr:hypothetical protein [Desulfovibrionaceae bacterium]
MFSEFWAHLPASIKIVLLQGTSRRDQLLHLARLCLRESENSPRQSGRIIDLTALASDFLLAAWEADPLNGRLASDVLKIFQTRLTQPLYALLHSISMNFAEPKESRTLEEVISKGNFEQEA